MQARVTCKRISDETTRPVVSDRATSVVACLGSSSTAGQGQAFGWIDELSRRPQNTRFVFKNLGVGGDFAYDALRRVPAVVAARPDRIFVLIGANDVLAMVFPNVQRFLGGFMKRHSREPSVEWFTENLAAIVSRLRAETRARIALSSLGPIGEAPDSTDENQRRLNDLVGKFSATIKQTAAQHGADYIPFYERLSAEIAASPGKALTSFRFLPIYGDTFRYFVLRKTSDEIGAANGWKFHVDGVHLNRRGGMILADLVQDFLDS
jgi:lysophospholipase L1-like esterase